MYRKDFNYQQKSMPYVILSFGAISTVISNFSQLQLTLKMVLIFHWCSNMCRKFSMTWYFSIMNSKMQSNTMNYEAVEDVLMLTMTSKLAQRQIFMGLGLVSVVWRTEHCPSACPLCRAVWYMEMKMMMTKVSLFLSIWRTSWPHSTTSTFKYNESTQTQLLRILKTKLIQK